MKTALLISSILLAIMFSGCNKNNDLSPDGAVFSKNFVQVYVVPETIVLQEYMPNFISVNVRGDEVRNNRNPDKSNYDILSSKYGDNAYNNKLIPYTNIVLADNIDLIDVICDEDIDENHLAGLSLKDIVYLCATSPYDYIKNNYCGQSPEFPEEFKGLVINDFEGNYPIFKPLSEISVSDLVLMNNVFYLYLVKVPTVDECNFTITVKCQDKELSNVVKYAIK